MHHNLLLLHAQACAIIVSIAIFYMQTTTDFPPLLNECSKPNAQRALLPCILLPSSAALSAVLLLLGAAAIRADTIGYWRFEEGIPPSPASGSGSVLDSSGHGLNATPFGGPLYSSDISLDAAGIGSTRSLQFDGQSQRLFVADTAILQLTNSLTIEAFFKPEPILPGTAGVGLILFRGDNRPGLDPYFLVFGPGNQVSFGVQDAAQNSASVQTTVPYDKWVFVAGTLDGATGQMKLYVNGKLVSSITTSVRPLAALDPAWSPGLSMGCDPTGLYGEYFHGWLDEIRLSNVALSPDQFLVPVSQQLAIRVSQVELSWFGSSGTNYQAQYRSSLTTNIWTNLGATLVGADAVITLTDSVPVGEPQRFYRVIISP